MHLFSGIIALYFIYPQAGVLKVFFALLLAVSSSRGNRLHGSVAENDVKPEAERYKWDDKEEQIAVTDYSLEAFPKQHDAEDDNSLKFEERSQTCSIEDIVRAHGRDENCGATLKILCELVGLECKAGVHNKTYRTLPCIKCGPITQG